MIWETLCFQCFLFRKPVSFELRKPLNNQKGQAIVEYILLIVVILSIAYALGRHFFTPLQKFGSSVFTSTIACALEYGQLPAEISSEDGCSTSMQSTGVGGSKAVGGGSKSNSNNQTSSKSGGDKQGKQDSQDKSQLKEGGNSKSNEGSSNSETSKSSEGGGASITSINSKGGKLNLSKSVGSESRTGKNSEVVTENTNLGSDGGDYRCGGLSARRRKTLFRTRQGDLLETMSNSPDKKRKIESNIKRGISGNNDEGKPKRINVTSKSKIKKAVDVENNWDMSKLIRMVLIVILIIGILLFVFMQVSQIRKGAGST